MRRFLTALPVLALPAFASPAAGCEIALVLAVDVSGSISDREYLLQVNGIADALLDPEILRALVEGQDALALVQWSGTGHQHVALSWVRMQDAAAVEEFSAAVRGLRRPGNTATAIGEALRLSLAQFPAVADCRRRVVDVSGDGMENDGMTLPEARDEAMAAGVTVNGLAIELGDGSSLLTPYYLENVVTDGGFVVTAKAIADFPQAIHEKLLRELTKPLS